MYKKFLLQLLLLLAWQCLTLPHHSLLHPTFKAVLPTFDVLQELFLQASLNFHKELFGILIGLKPPTLATLKKLPTFTARKIWGVYMIILKKADAKPKVYVGSGTEHYDNQGVHARLRAYDNPDVYWSVLPQYVRRAMKDGYSITHKAAICWIPIPSPGKAPMYRTLFLVLEALFMAVFRATISSAVLYGCGLAKVSCWDGIDFEWDGACGHSPLREAPIGQFDLSEEEITRIAAVLKEKLKARKTHNARRRRMRPGVSEQENINAQKSRAKILAEANLDSMSDLVAGTSSVATDSTVLLNNGVTNALQKRADAEKVKDAALSFSLSEEETKTWW
ncbi:hypothetical protein IWZ01DRAFT_547576 [Phyllosticta capitalensis]